MKIIQLSQRKPEKKKSKEMKTEQKEKYKMSKSSNNMTVILSNVIKIVRVD